MEEVDPQIRVARLDRLVNVFDVGDVKGARDAEDRQDDRLVFLVDENLEFFDLGLFREERSRFVSDGGLFRFFFWNLKKLLPVTKSIHQQPERVRTLGE